MEISLPKFFWRNLYAGMAMQGELAREEDHPINLAKTSFLYADAMIAEMEAREGRQDG